MRNIYNKGKYRSGEWAKHLRPYLKKQGNRKWRRTARDLGRLTYEDYTVDEVTEIKKKKKRKSIVVEFKTGTSFGRSFSYRVKYRSLRAAKDAMKRRKVIEAKIIE
jgi:hypothetical protein